MKKVFFLALAPFVGLFGLPHAFAPPKDLHLSSPRDVSIYAEALALQAKEDGLEFAIIDGNGLASSLVYGKFVGFSSKKSDFEYNPGVRVGANYLFDSDRWNLMFEWTFVKVTNSKEANAMNQAYLIPLWLLPDGQHSPTNQKAHAVWSANYNVLDFSLGKAVQVTRSFVTNPHFGGRIAFIDQHFGVHYGGFFGAKLGAISHNDNDFAGMGLRAGMDTEWILGKYFALFANVAGSLLWGNFHMAQVLDQGTSDGYNVTEKLGLDVPNLEMALGFGWGKPFYRDRFQLNLRLAYEFSEWWDINQLRKFYLGNNSSGTNDTLSRGNFTLNGVSFRLQVDL